MIGSQMGTRRLHLSHATLMHASHTRHCIRSKQRYDAIVCVRNGPSPSERVKKKGSVAQVMTLLGGGTPPYRGQISEDEKEEVDVTRDMMVLIGMLTAVLFVCSIDRAAMSVTLLPMSQSFHWDDSVKGEVSAAFFVGYTFTNLFGGYLATRFSPSFVLCCGLVLWCTFTMETPAAAGSDLWQLLFVRGLMGIGEGAAYPAIQNIVRRNIPESIRSRSLCFIYSGHQLGTIASYLLSPGIIANFGWESVFWGFGSLGFVWLSGWIPLVVMQEKKNDADKRELGWQEFISNGSSRRTQGQKKEDAEHTKIPLKEILQSRAFRGIAIAQSTVAIGSGLSFSWLPTYFQQQFNVDSSQASYLCLLPFGLTVLTTNCAGWIADGLVNNGKMSLTRTRKLMQAVASIGPAACLLRLSHFAPAGSHLQDAVALVTAWLALGGFSAAGYGANHTDLSKKYSGVLFGVANGLASVAGSISIYATGCILHQSNNDWGLIFDAAALIYIIGAVGYMKYASCEEEF